MQPKTKIRLLHIFVVIMLIISIVRAVLIPEEMALTCSVFINLLYLTHFKRLKWIKESRQLF